jgi:hypothetical protein
MGIFSRKRKATSSPSATSNSFIGRKFSSRLTVGECLENFAAAASQCYQVVGALVDDEWRTPSNVASVASTQVGTRRVPPAKFVAQEVSGGGRLHLAIWDDGEKREMWFVPPSFDGSPIPIAGIWKGLDGSLTSVGSVESAFWGA